jgi:AcrR family transcriptional regulator
MPQVATRSKRAAARRSYHHGDLRRAVLDAALEQIAANGPATISLREIAALAGVSHAAPAHHFGDKAGLLTSIATDGYRMLTEATRAAFEKSGKLFDLALAYLRFAIAHRAHFEVMFRPELYRRDDPELASARRAAGEVLSEGISHMPGRAPNDVVGTAVAAWSIVHGFTTLWLNGNFPPEYGDDPEKLARLAASMLYELAVWPLSTKN